MQRQLAGVTLTPQVDPGLLARLEAPGVEAIALPPGCAAPDVLEALRAEGVFPDVLPDLDGGDGVAALGAGVAAALGAEVSGDADASTCAVLWREHLTIPRLMCAVLAADAAHARVAEILRFARELAHATKDMEGPLGFLFLVPCPASAHLPDEARAWPALRVVVDTMEQEYATTPWIERGFRVYFGIRAFWETAGRGAALDALSGYAERWTVAPQQPDADERIDAWFDQSLAAFVPATDEAVAAFEGALDAGAGKRAVRTGRIPPIQRPALDRLVRAGVAWRPPGSAAAYLASQGLRALLEDDAWRRAYAGLEIEKERVRSRVRCSPLLSTWVLGLTSQIEQALLDHCRVDERVERFLEFDEMGEVLEGIQAEAPTDLAYFRHAEAVEHASFAQLQIVLSRSGAEKDFPLSGKRLRRVRQLRNLAAHLHAPRWWGVRLLLEALERIRGEGG